MQLLVLRGIMAYISKVGHFFPTSGLFLFKFQGVIRIRKRVTLMLAIVSGIFAICWGTIQVLYSLLHYTSYETSSNQRLGVRSLPVIIVVCY